MWSYIQHIKKHLDDLEKFVEKVEKEEAEKKKAEEEAKALAEKQKKEEEEAKKKAEEAAKKKAEKGEEADDEVKEEETSEEKMEEGETKQDSEVALHFAQDSDEDALFCSVSVSLPNHLVSIDTSVQGTGLDWVGTCGLPACPAVCHRGRSTNICAFLACCVDSSAHATSKSVGTICDVTRQIVHPHLLAFQERKKSRVKTRKTTQKQKTWKKRRKTNRKKRRKTKKRRRKLKKRKWRLKKSKKMKKKKRMRYWQTLCVLPNAHCQLVMRGKVTLVRCFFQDFDLPPMFASLRKSAIAILKDVQHMRLVELEALLTALQNTLTPKVMVRFAFL